MKNLFLFMLCLVGTSSLYAQVSITPDATVPDPSSMLDVQSSTKGMLIPRMTEAQRDAIASPAVSLIIYQTDGVSGFYFFNGIGWSKINSDVTTGGT